MRGQGPPAWLKHSTPDLAHPTVGASNLGHIILYSVLNQQAGLLCDRGAWSASSPSPRGWLFATAERPLVHHPPSLPTPARAPLPCAHAAYFPGEDLQALLAARGKPLFGVESRRPLADFHALGFSLAYELGGTNILSMLTFSGIPLTWRVRGAGREAGGGAACGRLEREHAQQITRAMRCGPSKPTLCALCYLPIPPPHTHRIVWRRQASLGTLRQGPTPWCLRGGPRLPATRVRVGDERVHA